MFMLSKEQRKDHARKMVNHFCGRLILWNVGTPEENSIILSGEYRHVKYELSPQIELKPCPIPIERTLSRSAAAIHKVLSRLNFVTKPVLH